MIATPLSSTHAPAATPRSLDTWDRAVAKARLARPTVFGPFPREGGITQYRVVGSHGDTYTVTVDAAHDLTCDCAAGKQGRASYHEAAVWLILPRCANCRDIIVDYPGEWCSGCTAQDVACRAQLQESVAEAIALAPEYWLPGSVAAVRRHLR